MEENREIVVIDNKKFYVDSLSEDSLNCLQDIKLIEEEVKRLQLSVNIALLAKNTRVNQLAEKISTFEEVPNEEKKI